uniref:WYL domain-containing protein n=1 Tax=Steinernema glaseri TaxID=37863 RepID=A0A1I8AE69_9BILA
MYYRTLAHWLSEPLTFTLATHEASANNTCHTCVRSTMQFNLSVHIQPQKLFTELRNRYLRFPYEAARLTPLELRIMNALGTRISLEFGDGIYSLEVIPTPLKVYCRRVQFAIQYLRPTHGYDIVLFHEIWSVIARDNRMEVEDLILVSRYEDLIPRGKIVPRRKYIRSTEARIELILEMYKV